MKALTLWRPWALYVARGEKRIENRPWTPPIGMMGQVIAIHAGRKFDDKGARMVQRVLGDRSEDRHEEGIIGIARIAGWCDASGVVIQYEKYLRWDLTPLDRQWLFGPFGWILRGAHLLKQPIACRGMQKLWNVPAEIAAQIAKEYP